jgi:hypothetical protein
MLGSTVGLILVGLKVVGATVAVGLTEGLIEGSAMDGVVVTVDGNLEGVLVGFEVGRRVDGA